MKVTRTSPFSGQTNTREINVTPEQLEAWQSGRKIQDVMWNVSADDREFIMTGITPEEWAETFKEEN
jgi:hypothetical protein